MKSRFWTVAVAAACLVISSATSANASVGQVIAIWDMNEPAGSRTMHDVTGHGFDGRIGSEVGTGSQFGGARGYRFQVLAPDTPPTHPQHLVVVPPNSALDPGSGDYAVTVRLRTVYQFGNIIQKGQATVPGGSWKLQIPSGRVQCWFRGAAGAVLVTAPRPINDGRWHVVRCARVTEGVALAIDGTTVAGRYGRTGRIANSWPVSIGGKTNCDQVEVGCDYFPGEIDYVALDR